MHRAVKIDRPRAAPAAAAARPLFRNQLRPRRTTRTSSWSRVEGDGARGLGRVRRRERIRTTAARPPRPSGTSSPSSSRRACSARDFAHPREVFPALQARSAATTWRRPPSRWRLGSLRAAARQPLSPRPRRHARPHRLRRVDRHPGLARRSWSAKVEQRAAPPATSASRSRSSRDGTSTPVERVRERFGDIPLMVDANAAYTLDDAAHLAAARRRST